MVALLTTRLRKAIDRGETPSGAFHALGEEGYLSDEAQRNPQDVIAAVERALEQSKTDKPLTGVESSHYVERELKAGGYLNARAGTVGAEFVFVDLIRFGGRFDYAA